ISFPQFLPSPSPLQPPTLEQTCPLIGHSAPRCCLPISPDSSTKKARVSCRHGRGGCIHLLRAISYSPIRTFPATQSHPRNYHPPWRTHPTSSSSTRPRTAWP